MKSFFFAILCLGTLAGCSKPTVAPVARAINPPIYVSFDPEGRLLFGPVSRDYSLSDGRPVVPGTDHTVNVFCSAEEAQSCTLTFQELAVGGRVIRETKQVVPKGVGYSFKIFDSVDVTIRNKPSA